MLFDGLKKILFLLFLSIFFSLSASSQYNSTYNKEVGQYCTTITHHPYQCYRYHVLAPTIYGGIMMTMTSGNYVGENTMVGLDIGFKLPISWGVSCSKFAAILTPYLDGKIAMKPQKPGHVPMTYGGQLTVAPGLQYGRISVNAGPYVAYSAFTEFNNSDIGSLKPEISGWDFGVRFAVSFLIKENIDLEARFDLGITDQNQDFKKNDLSVTVGYRFK